MEPFLPPALKYHTSEVISPWNSQQLNRSINTVLSRQKETKNQGSTPIVPAQGEVWGCLPWTLNNFIPQPAPAGDFLPGPPAPSPQHWAVISSSLLFPSDFLKHLLIHPLSKALSFIHSRVIYSFFTEPLLCAICCSKGLRPQRWLWWWFLFKRFKFGLMDGY